MFELPLHYSLPALAQAFLLSLGLEIPKLHISSKCSQRWSWVVQSGDTSPVGSQHGASQCLDKQNLPHRGWHVLLRHLKSRKLPLQHRQALGIFCWIIFFFLVIHHGFFVHSEILPSLGGPCRLVWWLDQLIDQLSGPGSWTHSLFLSCTWFPERSSKLTSRVPEQVKTGLRGGVEEYRFSLTKAGLKWTKISPLCFPTGLQQLACVTHRGGLFPSEASQRAVSMLRLCVCVFRGGWGACLSRNTFSQG